MMDVKFVKFLNSRWSVMNNGRFVGIMHRTSQGYWVIFAPGMGEGRVGPCRTQREVKEKLREY